MNRPNIHETMMSVAILMSERSTCLSSKYGTVITKDKQVISTGYNGAPKGVPHCEEVGCIRKELDASHGERYDICRATHSEQNAIAQAAYHGNSVKGGTLYVSGTPCSSCAKIIINAGIDTVIYIDDYYFEMTDKMFKEAGVEFIPFENVVENEEFVYNFILSSD